MSTQFSPLLTQRLIDMQPIDFCKPSIGSNAIALV